MEKQEKTRENKRKQKMLKLRQHQLLHWKNYDNSHDERVHDERININFIVWNFVEGYSTSVEFGKCFVSEWIAYCYNRPLGYWNPYANLTHMTDNEEMIQYMLNPNCSVAEFGEIIKRGTVDFRWHQPDIRLVRRTMRIPEYKKIMTHMIREYPG